MEKEVGWSDLHGCCLSAVCSGRLNLLLKLDEFQRKKTDELLLLICEEVTGDFDSLLLFCCSTVANKSWSRRRRLLLNSAFSEDGDGSLACSRLVQLGCFPELLLALW